MCSRLFVGLVLLFSALTPVMSQDPIYDTVISARHVKNFKVPITYFDYHVDGSNPDFGTNITYRWDQSGLSYGNIRGWADTVLTTDKFPKRSPALTDTFLSVSWNLNKLFKPWVAGKKDTFAWKMKPTIKDSVDTLGFIVRSDTIHNPDTFMISDTMFKTFVIADSLKAFWIPNDNTFEDTTDSMWTFGGKKKNDPISGRGFGDEGDAQNAGFAMTLRNKITFKGGEKVYLGGDDDVYMFINGKLALECGGFHDVLPDTVLLDSLHLTVGNKYDLDIFFVERRMGGNFYLGGLSDFDKKGAIKIDTMYDTTLIERPAAVSHPPKSAFHQGALSGMRFPLSSQSVRLEYFSISGVKVADLNMPLASVKADNSIKLSRGMYMVRATFLDTKGNRLSTGSFSRMIVQK